MKISREEFMQASWDARLELTPEEAEELEKQVKNIFEQAAFLQSSALDDAEATYFPLAEKYCERRSRCTFFTAGNSIVECSWS